MKKKMLFGIIVVVTLLLISMYFLIFRAKKETIFLDEFKGDNTKGRFVMEAENYSHRTSTANGSWWEVNGKDNKFIEWPKAGKAAPTAKSGAHGNYMETLGKSIGDITPISDKYRGSFLDYKISIEKAGTYVLYLRWTGRNGNTDSVYAFILNPDGTLLRRPGPDYLDFFLYHGRTDWTWDNIGLKNRIDAAYAGRNAYAAWIIPELGIYTIRLALRETETAVDTLVFQTENLPPPTEEQGTDKIDSRNEEQERYW